MNHPCQKTEVIDMIKDDVAEIKGDVKQLLQTQWKADGRSTVISIIVSAVTAIIVGVLIYKLSR